MKLRNLLLLLLVMPLTSCWGDSLGPTGHYTYCNATDDIITFEVYAEYHPGVKTNIVYFTLAPGEEHTLSYPSMSFGIGGPFDGWQNHLVISNGDTTVAFIIDTTYEDPHPGLFNRDNYIKIKTSNKHVYWKYVFTDKDFEDKWKIL